MDAHRRESRFAHERVPACDEHCYLQHFCCAIDAEEQSFDGVPTAVGVASEKNPNAGKCQYAAAASKAAAVEFAATSCLQSVRRGSSMLLS